MTNDEKKLEEYLDNLFEYIRRLEVRIIDLERELDQGVQHIHDNAWYWDH